MPKHTTELDATQTKKLRGTLYGEGFDVFMDILSKELAQQSDYVLRYAKDDAIVKERYKYTGMESLVEKIKAIKEFFNSKNL